MSTVAHILSDIAVTSYGYTLQWYKGYTELLHLRARWYSGETGTFLSMDPWEGDTLRPQTLSSHNYAYGNPINSRDPSGLAPPSSCYDPYPTQPCYDSQSFAPSPGPFPSPNPPPLSPPIPDPANQCNLNYYQFTAGGYAEGVAWSFSYLAEVRRMEGKELVFNFASMERGLFSFEEDKLFGPVEGVSTTAIGVDAIEYNLQLSGFDSRKSLRDQYSNRSLSATAGANFGEAVSGGFGTIVAFPSFEDFSSGVTGFGQYKSLSLGFSVPFVSGSLAAATYDPLNWDDNYWQYVSGTGYVTANEIRQMKDDIKSGWYSPGISIQINGEIHHSEFGPWSARDKAIENLQKVWETHQYYFENRFKDDQPFRDQSE